MNQQGEHYQMCNSRLYGMVGEARCNCTAIAERMGKDSAVRRERIWQATVAIAGGMVARGLSDESDAAYQLSGAKALAESLVDDFWGKEA